MVNLIPGANARIKQLIFEDSVRSDYLSTCERFTKGYINAFIGDMQRLITKLGIMCLRYPTALILTTAIPASTICAKMFWIARV